MPNSQRSLYSIGHSNHEWGTFVALLVRHGIERLVDVRSQPVSRYTPYFSYPDIGKNLATNGIEYTFLGQELGGRPDGGEFYDDEGHVLYDRWAASPLFQSGLQQLAQLAAAPTAMMCSEEDPCICHRRLLIARVLGQHKPEARAKDPSLTLRVGVVHIRGDGRLETDEELNEQERQAAGREQKTLFEVDAERPWKSLRSVLPKARPPIFSAD
jgi:uncharacterized protein (DUF488 family)